MIIPLAPPPPLQIAARPFWPDFNACSKWTTIRAPDMLKSTLLHSLPRDIETIQWHYTRFWSPNRNHIGAFEAVERWRIEVTFVIYEPRIAPSKCAMIESQDIFRRLFLSLSTTKVVCVGMWDANDASSISSANFNNEIISIFLQDYLFST